jgi:hypothetical protein
MTQETAMGTGGSKISLRSSRNEITEPDDASVVLDTEESAIARHEEITRRAYEIYLARGQYPGRELDDWLQAEREIDSGLV